jgi:peroxiredoxin
MSTLRVTLLAACALAWGCGPTMPPSVASPLVDRGLPAFMAAAIDGRQVDPSALRSKLVVVVFVAKSCAGCTATLQGLEALSHERRDVAFVGVAEDDFELDTKDLVTSYGITFPVVQDKGRPIGAAYKVGALPLTFLADRHGIVRWVGGTDQTMGQLREAIAVLE